VFGVAAVVGIGVAVREAIYGRRGLIRGSCRHPAVKALSWRFAPRPIFVTLQHS